jgi:hypothetical protein
MHSSGTTQSPAISHGLPSSAFASSDSGRQEPPAPPAPPVPDEELVEEPPAPPVPDEELVEEPPAPPAPPVPDEELVELDDS